MVKILDLIISCNIYMCTFKFPPKCQNKIISKFSKSRHVFYEFIISLVCTNPHISVKFKYRIEH